MKAGQNEQSGTWHLFAFRSCHTGAGHLTATEDGIYAVGKDDNGANTLYALEERDSV